MISLELCEISLIFLEIKDHNCKIVPINVL